MPARSLNLGILAHVDAGKTTLTERLLHLAGVIDEPGSVDSGTTRTDTLALERRRGITIKAAVVAFPVGDTTVNVVDTPGHPDFIAEVERVLGVLDGAVLVLSAVEGVQPQTRILMRALQRLHVPTLLFVNKIDRMGADPERGAGRVRTRLTSDVLAMGSVTDAGQPRRRLPGLRRARRRLPRPGGGGAGRARRHAARGLRRGAARLRRPAARGAGGTDPSRRPAPGVRRLGGHRRRRCSTSCAGSRRCCRPPTGSRTLRRRVGCSRSSAGPAGRRSPTSGWSTARYALGSGSTCRRAGSGRCRASRCSRRVGGSAPVGVAAGQIGRLHGLAEVRVGDTFGRPGGVEEHHFAPPTLEASVTAVRADQGPALRAALAELADQDPLIDVRTGDDGLPTVSLYGRVQQEVLGSTLAEEYGIDVAFADAGVLHVERPRRPGAAVARLNTDDQPVPGHHRPANQPGPAGLGAAVR